MRWVVPVLVGLVLNAPAARASAPLDLGTPPTLEWGEHRLSLQVGWPVQAIGLHWGTRSGWAGGVYGALDTQAPEPIFSFGLTTCRPFAHRARTSLFVHLAAALDLQHHRPAGPLRVGGEAQGGLFVGIGIGRQRRVTLELGMVPGLRVGPGLAGIGPTLLAHGSAGLTFHLAPEVALSLRGRAGIAGLPGYTPSLDWGVGAVLSRLF